MRERGRERGKGERGREGGRGGGRERERDLREISIGIGGPASSTELSHGHSYTSIKLTILKAKQGRRVKEE